MRTDLDIQKDVMDELRWEPLLDASKIGVSVSKGVVTLTGVINNYAKKSTAEKAAWRVKGVKAVAEELEVRLFGEHKLSDTEIAENVLQSLKWNTTIPDSKIKVKVDDARVFLDGEVEWQYQKDSAYNAIKYLKGVRQVINRLTVKPNVNTAVVKDSIKKALERNADLEAAAIQVEAIDSRVILKGKARSQFEKLAAERAAWSAPGVTSVDDQLEIVYS